jgi:dTDP-D-glucose 4,6-dehydratase
MINLGCTPKHTLKQGLQKTYAWYLENKEKFV